MTENEKAQIAYDASASLDTLPFTTTEIICKRVNWLRTIPELSWPEIAALAEFEPIPFGTLQQIYETGTMTHKWKSRLRWRPTNPRNRASINLDDMESAAQTIINYLGNDTVKLYNLIDILDHKFTEVLCNR